MILLNHCEVALMVSGLFVIKREEPCHQIEKVFLQRMVQKNLEQRRNNWLQLLHPTCFQQNEYWVQANRKADTYFHQ